MTYMGDNLDNHNTEPKLRQIIIETDGREIWIRKAEVSNIELGAICNMILVRMSRADTKIPNNHG